jgi:hypothetical protein
LWEPCCGSDAFSPEAEAGRRGGSWVINGTKLWITSDIYADAFLVAARTGPPEEKAQWMKECVETTPVTVMGVRGTGTAEVKFHDCEVGEVGMLLMGGRRVVSWVLKLADDVYSNFILVLSAYIVHVKIFCLFLREKFLWVCELIAPLPEMLYRLRISALLLFVLCF